MRNSRIEKTAKHDIENNKETNKEKKEKSKILKAIIIILKTISIIILVAILLISSWYLYELRKADGDLTKAAMGMLKTVASTMIDEEDPVYVLILGYSTDEGTTLTDTIILMGYNPNTQKAFMVSIPRDTYVGTNTKYADSYDKINALYSKEDASATVEAVENITGVDIDYYVTVNTETLVEIVDILGGVEFDVPIDMDYDDKSQNLHIHLSAGLQYIDGEKAEQLLRFRHNNDGTSYSTEYGDNDYGRMRTQREFIMALAEQCLEVNDLGTLKEIITTIFGSLETDCPLSVIFSYLVYAYDFDMDNLQMETIPGTSTRIPAGTGLYFFQYDEDETEELMEEILYKFNSEIPNSELDAEEEDDAETDSEDSNEVVNAY